VLEKAAQYGYKGGTLEAIDNFVMMIKCSKVKLAKKNAYELAVLLEKSTQDCKGSFLMIKQQKAWQGMKRTGIAELNKGSLLTPHERGRW
jgi:hypothetical protein